MKESHRICILNFAKVRTVKLTRCHLCRTVESNWHLLCIAVKVPCQNVSSVHNRSPSIRPTYHAPTLTRFKISCSLSGAFLAVARIILAVCWSDSLFIQRWPATRLQTSIGRYVCFCSCPTWRQGRWGYLWKWMLSLPFALYPDDNMSTNVKI